MGDRIGLQVGSEAVGLFFLLEHEIVREFPRERVGLDDAVDQVDGLIRPSRDAQGRGSGELHAVVEHDHHSNRRYARVRRFLVSGDVGNDQIGIESPGDLCTLLRHLHQFDDSSVFDQPLRVRPAATFQAEGADPETYIGFHDLVGRFGSVRDHYGKPQLLRDASCQQSLAQRADLVGLDQGSIDEPLLGASLDGGVLSCNQIVPDDEDLLVEGFHQFLPPFVIIFRERIFQRDDRKFLNPPKVHLDHFICGHHLRILGSPEQVLAYRLLLTGLFPVSIAEFAGRGIERDANIPVGNKAAFLDGLDSDS